jgi:hypothetical protein
MLNPSTKRLASKLTKIADNLPTETLLEILGLVKFLKNWEKSLKEKDKYLKDREQLLKSNYVALVSAKKELEKDR